MIAPRGVARMTPPDNTYQYAAVALLDFSAEFIPQIKTANDFWNAYKAHWPLRQFPQWLINHIFDLLSLSFSASVGSDDSKEAVCWLITDCLGDLQRSDPALYEPILHSYCLLACAAYAIDVESEFPQLARNLQAVGIGASKEVLKHSILNKALMALINLIVADETSDFHKKRIRIDQAMELYFAGIPDILQATEINQIEYFFAQFCFYCHLASGTGER